MPQRPQELDRTATAPRVVLVATEHPGNIGAAARAMDVMGLSDLWLVSPKCFPDPQARRLAAESRGLLDRVTVVDTLEEAIDDCVLAIAATRRSRQRFWPESNVSEAMQRCHCIGTGQTVAIVFGPEPSGLTTDQVRLCDLQAAIPTPANAGSLNLAQAVQVFAWEWFRLRDDRAPAHEPEEWASVGQRRELGALLVGHLAHWLADDDVASATGLRLRALWQRGGMTASEWRLLSGLLRRLPPSD